MNPLQQLQEDVCACLLSNPDTNFVPYSIYRKFVIESAADEAAGAWKVRVDGKAGIACLVMMPTLQVIDPNVPGPQYQIAIVVRVFHDPVTNNTGFSCEDIALANMTWLDGQIFEPTTQLHGDPHGDALAPNNDYPGMLVYDCRLVGSLPRTISRRTVDPDLAEAGGLVTLTCTDADAVIYYTIDGTTPIPPANAAELAAFTGKIYATPFAAAVGLAVRCVAWNPTRLPSSIVQGTIT